MRNAGILLLTGLLVGCGGGLNYEKQYQYRMHPPSSSATPSGLEVSFKDQRPRWEKRPFNDGYSLVSFHTIEPSPWLQLRDEIDRNTRAWPDPPRQAEVVVSSFRIVVKDEDRLKQEEEELQKNSSTIDESDSILGAMMTALIAGSISSAPVRTYPAEIQKEQFDANCRIQGRVTLRWKDGRELVIPVDQVANSGAKDPETKYWGEKIQEALRMALGNLGREIEKHRPTSSPPK